MGNEPVQIIPLLSVFEDDGEFTLRVDASVLAKLLTPQITRAIGEVTKARKLTLLTPTDTKIFKFTPNGVNNGASPAIPAPQTEAIHALPDPVPPRARDLIHQDGSAPPAPEIAAESIDEFERELAEAQKAEAEIRQAERMAKADPGLPVEEVPAKPVKRNRERPTPTSQAPCGRCQGQGTLDGGGACPVCRGQGSIAHFGRGGRR